MTGLEVILKVGGVSMFCMLFHILAGDVIPPKFVKFVDLACAGTILMWIIQMMKALFAATLGIFPM